MNIIEQLYQVLQSRKSADPETSYVASLYSKGAAKMAEKITEEAQEVIEEGIRLEKSPEDEVIREAIKNEAADLIFHLWEMLAHYNITPADVGGVLQERFGTSGHEEKAARNSLIFENQFAISPNPWI